MGNMIHISVVILITHLTDCVSLNSEGRQFVLVFPPHATKDVILAITGIPNTAVDITFRNAVTSHVIETDGTLDLLFNSSVRYDSTVGTQNSAMAVEAVSEILLHVFSGASSTSGYLAFPVEKLSNKYFLSSVDILRIGDTNRWTIVALEPNTYVTVNVKGNCSELLTFNLNKHDVIGGSCGHDFTGSDIISNKPIAVFYSTSCTGLPCHPIEEMVLPVMHYGKHYILGNAIFGSDTSYKIIAAEPDTTLSYSYGVNTSIGTGDVVVFNSSVIGQVCLLANKPILVVAVNRNGTSLSNTQPVERFLNKYFFRMTANLIQGQSDIKVTLTFHENYLLEIPVAYKETTSTIGCCRYVTATSSLVDVFNLQLEFPFGAQIHGGGNHTTAALIDVHFGSITCPPDAHYSMENNLCLHSYLGEAGLSWIGSRDFCGQRGQHLLQLDTQDKNEFVIAFLADVFYSVYIGANDMDGDGVLTWQNGDSVSYTNWADIPTSVQGKCVVLKRAANHKWTDFTCDNGRRILCQEDLVYLVDPGDFFYCQETETSSTLLPSSMIRTDETVSQSLQDTNTNIEDSISPTPQGTIPSIMTESTTIPIIEDTSSNTWTGETLSQILPDTSSILPFDVSETYDDILELSSTELRQSMDHISQQIDQSLFYSGILHGASLSLATTDSMQASLPTMTSPEDLLETLTIDTPSMTESPFVFSTFSSLDTSGYATEVKATPTSNDGSATLYSAILSSKCDCQCTPEQKYSDNMKLAQRLSEIKALLTIEKNSLTKQRGRFVSREDARPSAVRIGYSGILCLVCVACCVLIPDLMSILKRSFKRNRFSYGKPVTRMKSL